MVMDKGCEAEATFDGQTAYCMLLEHHLSEWHVGWHPDKNEKVQWQGPCSAHPEPSFEARLALSRMERLTKKSRLVTNEAGRQYRVVDKADAIFDIMLGTFDLVADHLDELHDWGKQIVRDIDYV
jgi:hypothetical protein